MPIHGSLKEMNVLETLQLVGAQRKSTTLQFTRGEEEVVLHLRDGYLLAFNVSMGDSREPFLDSLVALGHASAVDTVELRRRVMDERQDPWSLALRIPHLEKATCAAVYQATLEAILDDLVLWDRGQFSMHPLGLATQAFDPPLAIDALLLDTMRRLDELAAYREGEFAPDTVPCLVDERARASMEAAAADPIARAVLRQVDGRRSLGEIARAMPLGEYAVYQAVAEAHEQGHLQLLSIRATPAPRPAPFRGPADRREMRGSSLALAGLFAGLVAVTAVSGTLWRQQVMADRGAERDAARLWAEPDVERAIETYRYRHGMYPASLRAVKESGIPLPRDADAHWVYRATDTSFRLDPAQD